MQLWRLARTTIAALLAVFAVAALVSGCSTLPREVFPPWFKEWMPAILVASHLFDWWKSRRAGASEQRQADAAE